ncbi:MAG: ATP-binding protein [bacterium]
MNNKYSLSERLSFHNPWWQTGRVPKVFLKEFKREIFSRFLSYLPSERAILLKGPRRVGKTTLFYQLVDKLIKDRINPKEICYISFDDPLLKIPLEEILRVYEEYRGKRFNQGRSYLFLDEAQFLKDWELTVKLYIDRKFPIKFFISGSSISLLTQKVDSLAGRTIEEMLFPFSFREYIGLFAPSINLKEHIAQKEGFPNSFPLSLSPFIEEIRILFRSFLQKGGFPHLYEEEEEMFPRLLKDDILDKVIFRDLVEMYKLREPSSLERLFYYLGKNTASVLNLTTLSQTLGISRVVVERYISYLERSLLYFRLPKFSSSLKERLRSNPKGHIIDPSLGNLFGANKDQILESAISSSLFPRFKGNIYFWRDQFHEVDIIVDKEEIIPIEIKNSESEEVPKSLIYLMEKLNLSKGFVVYQGRFKKTHLKGKKVVFYPSWYFLLL